MSNQRGFSLVEIIVVVAIIAILASVATPAYINYMNRAKQGEAVEALLRAKMDMESFYAENARYAKTIGLLYSFGNTATKTVDYTPGSAANRYAVRVQVISDNTMSISATRRIAIASTVDRLHITTNDTCKYPIVDNPKAVSLSIFNMIFK